MDAGRVNPDACAEKDEFADLMALRSERFCTLASAFAQEPSDEALRRIVASAKVAVSDQVRGSCPVKVDDPDSLVEPAGAADALKPGTEANGRRRSGEIPEDVLSAALVALPIAGAQAALLDAKRGSTTPAGKGHEAVLAKESPEAPSVESGPTVSSREGGCGVDDIPFATLVRTEYARLFLGPRAVLAPLHESAYLSGAKRTFTSETLEVRRFFANYGYVAVKKNQEPEDSVSMELEFLHNLCERCIALAQQGKHSASDVVKLLEAQRAFMQQHLMRWVGDFAHLVIEHDRSGYFRAWARYLLSVLEEDESLLDRCRALAH